MKAVLRKGLARLDGWMNRLYGWRFNPLYHSGALTQVLMVVLLVTGLYLIFFYRIGSPYDSVARIAEQNWLGRWIRSLHRYGSDAAVVAIAFHVLRVFVQDRTWGPRTLAWVSGLILLFVTFVCGWTGYVMVWDVQGLVLAAEGARFLDALPIFSEPIARTFSTAAGLPSAFFFLNLFLHVALPVGIFILIWIHVSRVARPGLFPPRGLTWGVIGLLTALSVLWPVGMAAEADAFRIPGSAPFDVFYTFWVPVTRTMSPGFAWLAVLAVSAAFLAVPLITRPRAEERPEPSIVNEPLCDACRQCYIDCPYEAISMVPRDDSRKGLVAHVQPDLCVSCGICSGSCAPMGVGPPVMNGRFQLAVVKRFIEEEQVGSWDVVVVGCRHGAGGVTDTGLDGIPVYPVECGGSIHTSVIEYLVRAGAGGVLIVTCPPRDCWHREGPVWLNERLYNDREAELQPRVERRRVRVVYAAEGEPGLVRREVERYRKDIASFEPTRGETDIRVNDVCDPAEVEV